jgi:hypothetical protein
LNHDKTFTVIVLAIIWGIVMPALAWLAKRMVRQYETA